MWLLVTPEDLLRFLDAEGHTPQIVSFDTPG